MIEISDMILLLCIYALFACGALGLAIGIACAMEWVLNRFGRTLVPDDGDWEDE